MSRSRYPTTQQWVRHTDDLEVLQLYSLHSNWIYRWSVAQNTDDLFLLRRLSNDIHWKVRKVVAERNHSDKEIIQRLANDHSSSVRDALARHLASKLVGGFDKEKSFNPINLLNKLDLDQDNDS